MEIFSQTLIPVESVRKSNTAHLQTSILELLREKLGSCVMLVAAYWQLIARSVSQPGLDWVLITLQNERGILQFLFHLSLTGFFSGRKGKSKMQLCERRERSHIFFHRKTNFNHSSSKVTLSTTPILFSQPCEAGRPGSSDWPPAHCYPVIFMAVKIWTQVF